MYGINRSAPVREFPDERSFCNRFFGGKYLQYWKWWRGGICFGNMRGHRHWFYATGLPDWLRDIKSFRDRFGYENFGYQGAKKEVEMMRERVKFLQAEIDDMNEYIAKLESGTVEEKK